MNLHHLCLLQAVALIEATRTDELEPDAPSSTRAAPVLYPTLANMGMAPPPEEMERELLPGPPNRKQRRAAARRMR